MMLVGIIWASLAPASLVVAIAFLGMALRRIQNRLLMRWAMWISVAIVLTPVGAVWLWQRAEFVGVCEGEGKPIIFRRANADGLFLNSQTANSFGMRYLQEEGFAWIEAPSIYKPGSWVRYQRSGTQTTSVVTTEITALTARFEVREELVQPFGHTGLSQTRIIDRETSQVMAKAGSANFSGGAMRWVLGAWGMQSCPSALSSPEDFMKYYHLARDTLHGSTNNTKP